MLARMGTTPPPLCPQAVSATQQVPPSPNCEKGRWWEIGWPLAISSGDYGQTPAVLLDFLTWALIAFIIFTAAAPAEEGSAIARLFSWKLFLEISVLLIAVGVVALFFVMNSLDSNTMIIAASAFAVDVFLVCLNCLGFALYKLFHIRRNRAKAS
jgi:hypothetical protein